MEDWLQRCSCPGAPRAKDIHQRTREETERRRTLTKDALDEVVASNPEGKVAIISALEAAYSHRGLELSNFERESIPGVVEARLAPRPINQLLGLKAIGNMGFHLVREVRNLLRSERNAGTGEDSD